MSDKPVLPIFCPSCGSPMASGNAAPGVPAPEGSFIMFVCGGSAEIRMGELQLQTCQFNR